MRGTLLKHIHIYNTHLAETCRLEMIETESNLLLLALGMLAFVGGWELLHSRLLRRLLQLLLLLVLHTNREV